MTNTFFTSDTHIGHANILKYDNRPFKNIREHDEAIVRNWNAVVGKGDRVYHLGDFGFLRSAKEVTNIVRRLNGQKFLLLGNHDRDPVQKSEGWCWIRNYYELKVKLGKTNQKICLFHYPAMTWNGAHRGSWMLHGHCHGNLRAPTTTRLDVGTCNWNYTPISLQRVVDIMRNRTYNNVDGHQAI